MNVLNIIDFRIIQVFLYLSLAFSFVFFITKESFKKDTLAINIFLLALIADFIWSFLYFILKEYKISFYFAGLMGFLAFLILILFFKKSKRAGILFIPTFLLFILSVYLNYLKL